MTRGLQEHNYTVQYMWHGKQIHTRLVLKGIDHETGQVCCLQSHCKLNKQQPILYFAQLEFTYCGYCHLKRVVRLFVRFQQAVVTGSSDSKEFAWARSLGWEDPLEEGMASHSSILAWKIPMDGGA